MSHSGGVDKMNSDRRSAPKKAQNKKKSGKIPSEPQQQRKKEVQQEHGNILEMDLRNDLRAKLKPFAESLQQRGENDQNILHRLIANLPTISRGMPIEGLENAEDSEESSEEDSEGFEDIEEDQSEEGLGDNEDSPLQENMKRLFLWIVIESPKRLTEKSSYGQTPIEFAIVSKHPEVVHWLVRIMFFNNTLQDLEPTVCSKLGSQECSFCLNAVLGEHVRYWAKEEGKDLQTATKGLTTDQPPFNQNRTDKASAPCIHDLLRKAPRALNRIKEWNEIIIDTLIALIKPPTRFLHLLVKDCQLDENRETFRELVHLCCQEEKGSEVSNNRDQKPNGGHVVDANRIAHESGQLSITIAAQPTNSLQQRKPVKKIKPNLHLLEIENENGMTLLHFAVDNFIQAEVANDPLSSSSLSNLGIMIKLLLSVNPRSIYSQYKEKNPYQSLIKQTKQPPSTERDSVQEMFKECCIGNLDGVKRSRAQQIRYLYPDYTQEKNIEFDMMGEKKPITVEYLERLESYNIRYETVLRSLRLPLVSSLPKTSQNPRDSSSDIVDPLGYSEQYEDVFIWLKSRGVRKIFSLRVDDICQKPHGDSFIRNALSQIDEIEELDWRKLDIGSDTIVKGAPLVKRLRLYWSGSPSILQGWGCEDGLCKLVNLEEISLTTYMGKDKSEILLDCAKDFKDKVETRKPGIKVCTKSTVGNPDIGNREGEKGSRGSTSQDQDLWLEKMNTFNKRFENHSFKDRDNNPIEPEVRVVLIDDGVDIDNGNEEVDVSNKDEEKPYKRSYTVKGGTSFYESTSDALDFRQYFVAPGGHGNTMASFISMMCPEVSLFVIRVNDAGKDTTGARFTVKSCAEAIDWALDVYNADIISMSWSFEKEAQKKNNPDDVLLFEAAMARANKKILFASLHDEGAASDYKNYYPMSYEGVIRIGSSTGFGKASEANSLDSIHFALPGEKVYDSVHGKKVSGSSVATAIAAGLGALIIYCVDLARKLGIPVKRDERNREVMKDAFACMITPDNPKCPMPYKAFPTDFPLDSGEEAAKETLRSIINNLHLNNN